MNLKSSSKFESTTAENNHWFVDMRANKLGLLVSRAIVKSTRPSAAPATAKEAADNRKLVPREKKVQKTLFRKQPQHALRQFEWMAEPHQIDNYTRDHSNGLGEYPHKSTEKQPKEAGNSTSISISISIKKRSKLSTAAKLA